MISMDRTDLIDQASLKAYRQRWREVARIERNELQSQSILQRWQQLNHLRHMAEQLGLPADENSEEENQYHQNWARLKAAKHGAVSRP